MSRNGQTSKELTVEEKIDLVLATLTKLAEDVEALQTQQEEIVEKLVNLTISGSGFDIDEFVEN